MRRKQKLSQVETKYKASKIRFFLGFYYKWDNKKPVFDNWNGKTVAPMSLPQCRRDHTGKVVARDDDEVERWFRRHIRQNLTDNATEDISNLTRYERGKKS